MLHHCLCQAIWSDGLLGYPSGGKVFFGASAVVGIAITRWYGLFLDEGEGSRGSWYVDCWSFSSPSIVGAAMVEIYFIFVNREL